MTAVIRFYLLYFNKTKIFYNSLIASEDSDCTKDKHEILNPKLETNSKFSISKIPNVSDFDIRISDFHLYGLNPARVSF